jgi:hypothetical protein
VLPLRQQILSDERVIDMLRERVRIRGLGFGLMLALLSTSIQATNLRGRIDSQNPFNGYQYPRQGAAVQLIVYNGAQYITLRQVFTGPDGMYYFPQIAPGNYVLWANGLTFPLTVFNVPNQDIPVVFVP